MKQYKLSVLIPARNEEFLARTVEDLLENCSEETEIIVVLDGKWADPEIAQNDRVVVVYLPESVGQRAATNLACKLARGKFVMKCDAHCAFDKDFDRKMIEAFEQAGDDVTIVPVMRNLWVYDWKCYKCGCRTYQDKGDVCPDCGGKMRKKMVWIAKPRPQSVSYCFDSEPHFQYFEAYKHREPYLTDKKTGLTETMSLQGSCFALTRERYWALDICDETLGNWGSQGIEVAVKTWLSGGRVLCNHNTWYAHCFRTKGEVFGFPYKLNGNEVSRTKQKVRDLFFNNTWPGQIHDLSWLLERFWPVMGWTDEDLAKLKK